MIWLLRRMVINCFFKVRMKMTTACDIFTTA
jgi:hypothetical protein